MECLSCVKSCHSEALKLDENFTCVRIDSKTPIILDEDKCNDCGLCTKKCPIGDISLSSTGGCYFCVVCRGRPNCVLSNSDRSSLTNLISSSIYILIYTVSRVFVKWYILLYSLSLKSLRYR